MIITISGEPGGGKTLTMIRLALMESELKKVLHNIPGMKTSYIKNQHLLHMCDLMKKELDDNKSNSKTQHFKTVANWEFLHENRGNTFMLDEISKYFHSRNFMTKDNKCLSDITAEIRKITMDSGNFNMLRTAQRMDNSFFTQVIYRILAKHNNMYATSQTTSKIEKDVRDLSQVHIHCHSLHVGEHMFVYNDFYFIDSYNTALEQFESGQVRPKRAMFYANPYFVMYDRFAIVDMRNEGAA